MDDRVATGPPPTRRILGSLRRRANALYRRYGPAPRERQVVEGRLPLPDHLIGLDSKAGAALLADAEPSGDYPRLAAHFIPQRSPAFCGPATIAILLNSLGVGGDAPPLRNQTTIFTRRTEAVKRRREVIRGGMGLDVMVGYLHSHGLKAEAHFASAIDVDAFRAAVVPVLDDPSRLVAVNYHRAVLGQQGNGHISPLAAYHAPSDRFLILDVAPHRYPPVWVRATHLFDAMNTRAAAKTRGFVVVGA